jgi:branched-chain amino acid transport system permease protein
MAVMAAYISWALLTMFGIDPLISLIIVSPIMVLIGFIIQKFLLNRFLLKGAMDAALIVTFALGMVIRNSLQALFSADPRSLAQPYLIKGLPIGFLVIPFSYLIDFISALTMFIILHLFFVKTFAGRALRAVPQNREAAMMLGVKPEISYIYAMGIMALTQAIFGVFMGLTYTFYPNSGSAYLLLPFSAIMLAGLGSLKKTFAGGLIMGEILILCGYLLGSEYQLIICYVITLIIILFKPEGLFTRRS